MATKQTYEVTISQTYTVKADDIWEARDKTRRALNLDYASNTLTRTRDDRMICSQDDNGVIQF